MCDGCGCGKANSNAPEDAVRYARRKAAGWHVHADGTVHRHDDHQHEHSHHYAPVPEPELQASQDNGTGDASDVAPLSSKASIG